MTMGWGPSNRALLPSRPVARLFRSCANPPGGERCLVLTVPPLTRILRAAGGLERVAPRPDRVELGERANLGELVRRQRAVAMREQRELQPDVVAEQAVPAGQPVATGLRRARRQA